MSDVFGAPSGRNGTAVPDPMRQYPQFVLWRLVQKPNRPKLDKVPFNPLTGLPAAVDNPATWTNYETARATFERGGFDGIGFVFTPNDPFVFVDLDDCLDQRSRQWKPHAYAMMSALPGAWEISQSGNGLHGIGYARDKVALVEKRRRFTDENGNRYECYAQGRFVALHGVEWIGHIGTDWTDALASLLPAMERTTDYPPVEWVDQSRVGYDGPIDDDELIRRALASTPPLASLGRKPSFALLWNADPKLGDFYPDEGGLNRSFDHSAADLALMNALAWWTGCNPLRMERLFNRSALTRSDQRKCRLTISKAIADPNRPYFSRAQRLRDDQQIGDDIARTVLPNILSLDQAHAEFVFIGDGSHIVSRAAKTLRKFGDAVHEYAASKHPVDTGKIDNEGRPIVKVMAVMRLWLESQNRLSADTITWAPGEPEFCHAPERLQAGNKAYNLWMAPPMLPAPADWHDRVKPFIQHVAYLVPNDPERTRFLQWIGHIFQRPGELPHTCYLMIATETGIGRGTLASILTRALRGYVAANMNVDALFGGFNGRISQKLLATIDEVREGNSSNRYAKAESLKSKITEEVRALNPKYGAQSVEKNCCRWLMFSNHLDALPFDNGDRRIIVIENPTSRAQPEWYCHIHALMTESAFIASVQRFFLTIDLAGFSAHEPAPINEAKRKALAALESDITRACREFSVRWPDELATVADLRAFIGDDAPTASRALQHEIERAGMRTACRIKMAGKMQTVLIVRGSLTSSELASASKLAIVERIAIAQQLFRSMPG